MKKPAEKEDHRLTTLTKICLAMPEATRQILGRHAGFYIRKKTFAYFLDNHHGDGIVGINCKVLPGDNTALIASNPAKYYRPAYIGSKGWVGLRLDVGEVDWEEVEELVKHSYRLIAPKRLAAAVRAGKHATAT
jgi:predicted DNA-binding protein (MmcQ/YjbR family)